MLTISRELHDKIIEHARKDHPDEACGVIAGAIGSDKPTRFIPIAEQSDDRLDFLFLADHGYEGFEIGRQSIRSLRIEECGEAG